MATREWTRFHTSSGVGKRRVNLPFVYSIHRGGESTANMKYPGKNSPNVDSWFSSSAEQGTGLGGGWQLAWQWKNFDEPNMSGNLKRVFIFPESVSHAPLAISSMRSLSNLEG